MPHPEQIFSWTWDLASPPAALWPLVSNTDRFNRDCGYPPVTVVPSTSPHRRLRADGDGHGDRMGRACLRMAGTFAHYRGAQLFQRPRYAFAPALRARAARGRWHDAHLRAAVHSVQSPRPPRPARVHRPAGARHHGKGLSPLRRIRPAGPGCLSARAKARPRPGSSRSPHGCTRRAGPRCATARRPRDPAGRICHHGRRSRDPAHAALRARRPLAQRSQADVETLPPRHAGGPARFSLGCSLSALSRGQGTKSPRWAR